MKALFCLLVLLSLSNTQVFAEPTTTNSYESTKDSLGPDAMIGTTRVDSTETTMPTSSTRTKKSTRKSDCKMVNGKEVCKSKETKESTVHRVDPATNSKTKWDDSVE